MPQLSQISQRLVKGSAISLNGQRPHQSWPISRCPDCEPYSGHPWHLAERFANWRSSWLPFERLPGYLKLERKLFAAFFLLVWRVGFLREQTIEGREQAVDNRSLVVAETAVRRGWPFRQFYFLGRPTHFYSLALPGRRLIFEHLPHCELGRPIAAIDLDDKALFKLLVSGLGFPVPLGQVFKRLGPALEFARVCGYPLAAKPVSGSLSRHTTINIRTDEELSRAFRSVKRLSQTVLVERSFRGQEYRATLVGGRLLACCWREPAHIVGDGQRTIAALIAAKNHDPRRGDDRSKNFTLRPIPFNQMTEMMLRQAGLGLDDIVPAGRKLYLQWKVALRAGGDLHDVTDLVHPKTRILVETIAQQTGCKLLGLDLICDDIRAPWRTQSFAVVEANSAPRIDMHHYPTTGRARDVAGPLLDHLLG